jgi:hypothetical protein
MLNIIKFRSKLLHFHDFVYGYYEKKIIRIDNLTFEQYTISDSETCNVYEVCNDIVDEFTGLYYVDGKESYENDIFKDDRGRLYRIYKVKGGFSISLPQFPSTFTGEQPFPLQPMADEQTVSWFESQAVYVGNIHDNKDLLKKIFKQ